MALALIIKLLSIGVSIVGILLIGVLLIGITSNRLLLNSYKVRRYGGRWGSY
jgi:hypothetical protein